MTVVLGKITSVFIIIAIGFAANRIGFLPKDTSRYMSNTLMFITSPCLILSSITEKELTPDTVHATIELLVASAVWFVIFTALGYVLFKKIIKITPATDTGVYIYMFASISNGFMGIPVTMSLFDENILYLMILHSTVLSVYLYAVGIPFVHIGTTRSKGLNKKTFISIAKMPGTFCAVIAIIMFFAGIHFPSVVFQSIDMIGQATIPLSMLIVGIQLGGSNLGRIIKNKQLLFLCVFKMLSLPLLTFMLVNWLPIDVNTKITLIFGAAFPIAVGTVAVSEAEGANALIAAEGTTLTTVISLVILPLTASLLISFYGL